MAARRLVLNGLTAEVGEGGVAGEEGESPDSLEFYHELELYRQLVALPPALPPAPPAPTAPRRARTPDPPPTRKRHEPVARRSRTPAPAPAPLPAHPAPLAPHPLAQAPKALPAKYLGCFPVEGEGGAAVSDQLHLMKENGRAVPVLVVVALSGVKVCDPEDKSVRMVYALRRILYARVESARALFAVVAREPRRAPPRAFCHAFHTDTPDQAEELNSLLGDAFRMAFASQLHPARPTAPPLWSKEVSGERAGSGMGMRPPDSLPVLPKHYPHCGNRSGAGGTSPSPSGSSSSESRSPEEVCRYRRLGDRPPLMRRLARGFGGAGALLHPSDDDSTPLVADTPTTPTNLPLCMNGGYINEATEAEARTRESNREHLPVPLPPTPRRNDNLHDVDDFRRCNNKNSPSVACSRTASSSSGASSCGGGGGGGGGSGSGNNNAPRAEPDLRHAPWFQHGIPREIALEVLGGQPVGAFLVRGSTTQAGCFALSVRVPRDFQPAGIAHYLILRTPKGYKIKGFTKEFRSLSALVTHHSVMPELLPVPLQLPRGAGGAPRAPRRDLADIDAVAPSPAHSTHPAPHHHAAGFLKQLDV